MTRGNRMRWVTFGCYGTLIDGPACADGAQPFDDVEPMLAELRRQGYRLAVLTNAGDARFERTHRSFRRPFDLFVTGERIRGAKPEPWHFRGFARLTRAARHDWVHVARSWHHDIVPARVLGVRCVWLDRDGTGAAPDPGMVRVRTAAEAVPAVVGLFESAELDACRHELAEGCAC